MTLLINKKHIFLPKEKDLKLFVINNKRYIVLTLKNTEKYFCFLPNEIDIQILNLKVYLLSSNLTNLIKFECLFKSWLESFDRLYKKSLVLKGLGYKVLISLDKKKLEFKLGLSHSVSILIPNKNIIVKLKKNTIVIEGFNRTEVGNFAYCLKSLKIPDSYKGKGIWYKNEIKILKEVKKK
jgi:hypothetical protein